MPMTYIMLGVLTIAVLAFFGHLFFRLRQVDPVCFDRAVRLVVRLKTRTLRRNWFLVLGCVLFGIGLVLSAIYGPKPMWIQIITGVGAMMVAWKTRRKARI